MSAKTISRVVSFSGGKDSTALYLLMLERGKPFRAVFCDTDNENQATYDYIADLPGKTGGPPIETIRADFTENFRIRRERLRDRWSQEGIPEETIARAIELNRPSGNLFVDACILRAGFPYAKRRFCTEALKIRPITKQVFKPILDAGKRLFTYNGVRAEESFARSTLPPRARRDGINIIRPLLHWKLAAVMEMHGRHGIKPNPLYSLGVQRVGCWPCVFSSKGEVAIIAKHSPEKINRIFEWEKLVSAASKWGTATFFPGSRLGIEGEVKLETHGIHKKVEWARTSYGGRQFFLFEAENPNAVMEEYHTSCTAWGTCE